MFNNFKKLISGEMPKTELLVPLLIWSSGSQNNIENAQTVNKLFSTVNNKTLIKKLTYNNKCTHIIKYPKRLKDDEKLRFFYKDACNFFGWTYREFLKNIKVLNIEQLKETISKAFAYDKKQIRLLKKIRGKENDIQ